MPSFVVEVKHEVEFEVYCDTCGDGLCNESRTVLTRTRGEQSVRVSACNSFATA